MENDPRGGGREDYGAEHRGVQIAHNLFERKQHRCDRSVECGGERGSAADRHERLNLILAETQLARDDGREAGADVNRRPLAAECNAAGERRRAADELSDDRAKRDAPVVNEKRGAGLWDAAAAREWEIAIEQVAGQQRAQRRNKDSSPAESASRVHVGGKSSGKKNECDDDQADERADEKAEDEGEPVLLSPEVLDQSDEALRQSSESYAGHLLKLQGVTAARVASRLADRIRCVSRRRSEQL